MYEIPSPLPAKLLRRRVDPDTLGFSCTSELATADLIIGQDRALKAIHRAMALDGPGFNLFAVGLARTGRQATVRKIFDELKPRRRRRRDFVFVQNLKNTARPRVLVLPVGRAEELRQDLHDLRRRLPTVIKNLLDEEVLRKAREMATLHQEIDTRTAYVELGGQAAEHGLVLGSIGEGAEARPALFYLHEEQPLSRAALRVGVETGEVVLERPPEEVATAFDTMSQVLAMRMAELSQVALERQREVVRLQRRGIFEGLRPVFEPLRKRYTPARPWLTTLQKAVSHSFHVFSEGPEAGVPDEQALMEAFYPNIIHRGARTQKAPVIVVADPSFANVMGGVDMGLGESSPTGGFSRLRAGALLDADGGYLILNARALLEEPMTWRALKRALVGSQWEVRNPESLTGGAVAPIRAEPVPLDVKVVLLGDPGIYEMLRARDPEFQSLFKIKAEFSPEVDYNEETPGQYGRIIARMVSDSGLKHLDHEAVARLVEEAIRHGGRGGQISARFEKIKDVVREAAEVAEGPVVHRQDLEQALSEREERVELSRVRMDRAIREGRIRIQVSDEVVGQVNALAVYHTGDLDFGRAFRVTAQVGAGRGGVASIEREVGMSGRTHDKGVQILTGFLRGHFARTRTLALKASICFEQSYVRIDGDSASTAELLALISAIARVPLRQSMAITGSVDQLGFVQTIGGVNEKIEGFFRTCREGGFTGEQGVLIPETNVPDLMLSQEVCDACAAGEFHVWPVSRVEEALALLTGRPVASAADPDSWEEGGVFASLAAALDEMEVTVRKAGRGK